MNCNSRSGLQGETNTHAHNDMPARRENDGGETVGGVVRRWSSWQYGDASFKKCSPVREKGSDVVNTFPWLDPGDMASDLIMSVL